MTQSVLFATPDSDITPVTEDAVVDGHLSAVTKGTISEKLVEVAALRRGWHVATNTGGGDDFDHIIKRPQYLRGVVVQVRLAFMHARHGSMRYVVPFRKTAGGCYSATAFDVFAVHLPDTDEVVFFTRAETGNRITTTYTRRASLTRNSPSSAMAYRDPNNWHLLDEVAASLSRQ